MRDRVRPERTAWGVVAWLAALVLLLVALAFTASMGWVAWSVFSQALSLFEGETGLAAAYLLTGAVVSSFLLSKVARIALNHAVKAGAAYPDRISKLVVGIWTLYPYLWATGLLATPVTVFWPLALASFSVWSRRQHAARLRVRSAAEAEEMRHLEAAIRQDREGRGPDAS